MGHCGACRTQQVWQFAPPVLNVVAFGGGPIVAGVRCECGGVSTIVLCGIGGRERPRKMARGWSSALVALEGLISAETCSGAMT